MRLNHLAPVAILLSSQSVFAATTGGTCAAQAIIDRCVQDQGAAVAKCNPVDSKCQCEAHKAIVACYQNCPNDPDMQGRAQVEQSQITIYCNAASQAQSASSSTSASTSTATSATASSPQKSDSTNPSPTAPNSSSVRSGPTITMFSALLISASLF